MADLTNQVVLVAPAALEEPVHLVELAALAGVVRMASLEARAALVALEQELAAVSERLARLVVLAVGLEWMDSGLPMSGLLDCWC